jgi:glycosyltransferase involved in cell wall biosynthesis
VRECHGFLDSLGRDFELILVDDGSTDSTPGILDRLSGELESTRAVHHDENLGYGRALATGFAEARYPLVFYTDGDMQFEIEQLESFLEDIENADMVVGYRENREDSLGRKAAAWTFNRLAALMLPIEERDIDCGFKLVRQEVLEEIELETERTVDAELLAKARSRGYSIRELPVEHRERPAGESEASGVFGVRPGLVFKSIQELIQIRGEL